MHLLNLVLKSVCLVHHRISFLLEERPQFLVQVGEPLSLCGILLDLAVLHESLFPHTFKVLIRLLLDPIHVPDLFIQRVDVLLSRLFIALHLEDLILQFLVFEH